MTTKNRRADIICAELEQMIASGQFEDGEKLNEGALADTFGVSRTPLREALQTLSGLGLVDLIPNRGAFVKRPSVTRLVEMFEVMAELEAWCAARATKRITPAQRLFLGQAAQDCETALKAKQIETYYDANYRLHCALYDASGNSILAEEAKRMERRLRPFRRAQLGMQGRLNQSMEEHAEILVAIDSGDADKAADLMRKHINMLSTTYDAYVDTLATSF